MCGIVSAVSYRNIVPILVQGLQRLEYRGYDSCGVAVHAGDVVVGDEDGVVVLPRAALHEIAGRLDALREREAATDARARAGATTPPEFEAMLKRAGISWVA
jgi:glucosamine--fructose-6-phosphate aminotransferase (isomerizing)